jgi:ankyrin repeat protein
MIDAIAKGKAGVVRYLLDHGANPNCKDDNKIPALHRAIQLVSEDYTKGHAVLGLLLDRGADPSIKSSDEKGESGLHIAARSGDIEVARMLVGDGADPRSQDSQGRPILFAMLEAEVDEYEIGYLRSLLLCGADVEQADKNGRRVLHLAAERGLTGFMWRLLHMEGASPDPVDNQGKTPLIYAQEAGCLEAEAMLRSFTRR